MIERLEWAKAVLGAIAIASIISIVLLSDVSASRIISEIDACAKETSK